MTEPLQEQARQLGHELAAAITEDPLECVEALSQVRSRLEGLLSEAMAVAALEGQSMRAISQAASLAPNSVPPRLARTSYLREYAEGSSRVTLEGVARARHDYRSAPLRFVKRRSEGEAND